MMPSLVVLALTVVTLAQVGSGFPAVKRGASPPVAAAVGPGGGRERFASRDDVNVVAYGMLQLGQGLREHVDKNKLQMRDFNAKLQLLNGTLARLTQGGLHRDGEVVVEEVEARELEERRRVEALASELRASAEEARADREAVLSRMDRLEERINQRERESESNDSGSFIQRILEAQNKQIDDLVEKIRQQQDKLEKNNLHLQTLQSKVVQTALREDMMEHNEPQTGLAKDCQELFEQGQRASGVYTIQPLHSHPFPVLCEMTAEGGWTVVQKRQDGSQNFNQLWIQYQKGFGSLDGEFWLGLEHIHSLSKHGQHVLEVELSDWTGQKQSAQYHFDLDGAEQNYALHLHADPSSSSPAGSLEAAGASGRPFSTSDRDNDLSDNSNCAKLLSGGWWFSSCGESNLNGRYPRRHSNKQTRQQQTMFWKTMTARHNPIRSTTLKIKHL